VRWIWLIPRLILVGLIWSAFVFGLDPWLRHVTIQTAQSATGAKADIGSFTTGLFPPILSVRNVTLAGNGSLGTNLLEFDGLECRLGGHPLLRKSFVIEEARLTGVRFGTSRNDDGQLDLLPETDSSEPSWLTEKLKHVVDEWLDGLIVDVHQQLDPNTLETCRTGQALSIKWKQRIEVLRQELKSFKLRVERLQDHMQMAKQLRSVAQVQRYLQLASEGELLLNEANQLQVRIQRLVPEVRTDLVVLNQARQNDQRQIVQRIRHLKPNPHRITESLIGRKMYHQLHQTMSWLKFVSNYRKEIRRQTTVVRHRGQDVQFPVLNPTPRFLCRRMEVSGELFVDQQLTPFHAVLSDVSSEPALLGRPSVFRLSTASEEPLQLTIRHDHTTDIPHTDILVKFRQSQPQILRVGREEIAVFEAGLANLDWLVGIQLSGTNVDGTISLDSELQYAKLTSQKMNPLLRDTVADAFRSVKTVDATIRLTGTIDAPSVELESAFGEDVASKLQVVFAREAEELKVALRNRVEQLATENRQRLSAEFNSRYKDLVADHQVNLQEIQGAQQILASVRSDPKALFRQVSGSGILSKQKEDRIQRQLEQTDKLLQGLGGGIFR